MTAPVVIVGSGHAGYTLARELRRLDTDTPLVILTRDDGAAYYKPNLSKAFALGKDADGLVQQPATQMAQTLNAEVRSGATVSGLDADAHALTVNGETLPYARLVLAMGAQVIRLPLAGDAADAVLSVNDRQDYARFRAQLNDHSRVLIVGAGLIGCEFANDLAAAGHAVTVADIAAWPLPRLLPQQQGQALRSALEGLGVRFHLQCGAERVDRDAGALRVTLGDGSAVTADVVLSAVGLNPDTQLAQAAGLRCARGIVVDDYLQTSAPDVYALGDCVEIAGQVLPFVLPIAHGARALAKTLAGDPTKAQFPAMPVTVKTPACPTIVCPPPPVEGRWQVSGTAPDLEALYMAGGKALGFALTGGAIARRGEYAQRMPPLHAPE